MYPTRPRRLQLALALSALVALLAAQQVLVVPGSVPIANGLQNALHGPWFATVTWLVLRFVAYGTHGWRTVAVTAVLGTTLAVATKAFQTLTGRDAEWSDVGFDLIGAAATLWWWCGRERLLPARFCFGVAGLLLIVSFAPLLRAVASEWHRASNASETSPFKPLSRMRGSAPTAQLRSSLHWSAGPRRPPPCRFTGR